MYHNISAGRLRHYIEVFADTGEQDEDTGELIGETLVFDAWADCSVRSSNEAYKFGSTISETTVTVLMWYDERLTAAMKIRWNDVDYEVKGQPQPSGDFKSMIATMQVIK